MLELIDPHHAGIRQLALRNLLSSKSRCASACAGVALSVFLMLFQGSLFVGFLQAAGKVIKASEAEVWMMPRGVPCFDFPAPLEERIAGLARNVAGVAATRRIVVGFTHWKRPDGVSRVVNLIGSEQGLTTGLPQPQSTFHAVSHPVTIDRSNSTDLGIVGPAAVEISARRAWVASSTEGFGSFLGSPYVFAGFDDARRWLGTPRDRAHYVAIDVEPPGRAEQVALDLGRRFPELDVKTSTSFARESGWYWMIKTGAGGGIAIAGLLGIVVGCSVVSQTVYANTMEFLEEFATLRAFGARSSAIRSVFVGQALIYGVAGILLGLAVGVPLIALASRTLVSWIDTPAWLYGVVVGLALTATVVSALIPG